MLYLAVDTTIAEAESLLGKTFVRKLFLNPTFRELSFLKFWGPIQIHFTKIWPISLHNPLFYLQFVRADRELSIFSIGGHWNWKYTSSASLIFLSGWASSHLLIASFMVVGLDRLCIFVATETGWHEIRLKLAHCCFLYFVG